VITLLSTLALLVASGDDPAWPDYRGPGLDGHAPAGARLPLTWSEEENVVWKTPIWGRGWSSPVVADGRVWLTSADPQGHRRSVICVDLDSGEVLLDRQLLEVAEPEMRNPLNSYASPSPVLGGGRVFVLFGSQGLFCLDTESFETLWSREDLHCDHMMGPGSSPILVDDRLVIHYDGGDEQYVVALDPESGETIWRSTRSVDFSGIANDLRKAYATPVTVRRGGRTVLVSTGARATYGYDAADGEELWRVRHTGFSMSARPLVDGEQVLINTGFMAAQLWALRLGGEGDVSATHVAWKVNKGIATIASGAVVDGLVFQVSDGGVLSCLDAASGDRFWRERVAGDVCSSLLIAGERVYLFDRAGKTVVFEVGAEFHVLAENELEDGCMASPAVAGNALIVRTKTHLYRLQQSEQER